MENSIQIIEMSSFEKKKFASTYDSEIEKDVLNKLNGFADLNEGWSFGEGRPIKLDVIEKAKKLFKIGNFFVPDADVFAGTDGCVLVVFYVNNISLEFTVNEDLSVDASIEEGIGFNFDVTSESENITLREAEHILNKFNQEEWKFSGLFITTTTTQELNDLEVPPSKTRRTREVFQSLIEDALSTKSRTKKQFVTIS
jgi:hypothetical protein